MTQAKTLRRRGARGFTLIELLVVIIILAILATIVIVRVQGRTEDAKESKTYSDITALESSLNMFQLDTGAYPTTDQGLKALVEKPADSTKWKDKYINILPTDAWGNEYVYKCPSEHNMDFDIYTTTPDGRVIGNWNISKPDAK